ncbi:amino acid adenylation domain-containing protein, partial [Kitasatospora sp. NPDC056651]|uniref:amino acid adenylation domain-containing protein n=1 Tax=Kitasatospora sp. NPDC056651 TaxID=3345892 RepID=UPI0036C2405E
MSSQPQPNAHVGESSLTYALIAGQAAAAPDAVAVSAAGGDLTYGELEARSNQLAHLLVTHGAAPERLVGVCVQRGTDLLVTLLAVWKAGAAYVPLDAHHPRSRTEWVLENTGAELVVVDRRSAEAVDRPGVRTLVLDDLREEIASHPQHAPATEVTPDNAAYVMYTSGSTGRPKGVVISHTGIAHITRRTAEEHRIAAGDRVLQKTTLTFDASALELFAPLIGGATVVMAPAGVERDPAAMVRVVAENNVTVLQVVPSVLRLLVEEPGWQDCTSLRLLLSAGEPLHAELVQRARRQSELEVWNGYGPTECSINATEHLFDGSQTSGQIPIGRPIKGTQVLVLDPTFVPVPVGVVGELFLGGAGVARGYLGLPSLTAERFVPDPYGKPGTRLYRTGDLVRWRSDGTLEYVDRTDHQVKINGVRIEPGEIENALAAHPAVQAAVITSFRGTAGYLLAAYVRGEDDLSHDELRAFLRERLPATHVPSVFVRVAEFPLTANGKVDRAALPSPDAMADPAQKARVAPRTTAERQVARAWAAVLGTEPLSVHDDVFRLGVSSLQLTMLANQLRAASGQDIPLRALFGAGTVESQALLLAPGGAPSDPVLPIGRDGALPLSFGQRRLWFLDQLEPRNPEWVTGLWLRVPEGADTRDVQQAVDTVVDRHEILRTTYTAVGGEPVQIPAATATVPVRVREIPREELTALLREELGQGFDLTSGPVIRVVLVRLPDQPAGLLVTVHHIAFDGWSAGILERELRTLLADRAAGRGSELPELTVQYADYATWEQEQLTDEVVKHELEYWHSMLDDLTTVELPLDRVRPAVRSAAGDTVPFAVPAPVAKALLGIGRQQGATPFMTLLTAFATLLSRYSGQWDVPVGTPVTSRNRPELEGMVGFFLNSLVLRCRLEGDLSYIEAVTRLRDTCREAFTHDQLPFERLVDELAVDRDMSRTPLYQVAFDLHDELFGETPHSEDGADDLTSLQEALTIAKTDLTLYMKRQADGSLVGTFEYATSILDRSTVERMADGFVRLLESFATDPHGRLESASLVSREDSALLTSWNATDRPGSGNVSVPELIERQTTLTPDTIAVVADGT